MDALILESTWLVGLDELGVLGEELDDLWLLASLPHNTVETLLMPLAPGGSRYQLPDGRIDGWTEYSIRFSVVIASNIATMVRPSNCALIEQHQRRAITEYSEETL